MTENLRVAIVTGAAGGIGRAMTRALLAAGIGVAGVDRDREPLEALAASASSGGRSRSTPATRMPAASSARVISLPMPPAAPVTMATRWFSVIFRFSV